MGKITKNYIYNLLYQLFVLIVPLITTPYLAYTLGAEKVGSYGYVHSMAGIICTFTMLGIFSYGNRQVAYVRDDREKLSEVFWQIMSVRGVIAVISTIIYFVVVCAIGRYITLFFIYYTYMLAYYLDPTWLYVGVEDMKWAVIKNTLTKLIAVAGIFVFVKTDKDINIYVLIQGTSVLISNLLAYSQIKRYIGKPRFDLSNFMKDISGSALLFLPGIATTIYTQCDKIMIELMTGASSEVAFYDYSEKIVTIPLTFITVISTVMMPRIAHEFKKGHKENILELLNKAAKFSLFIAFPMMVGLMVASTKLIPWYLGEGFTPTIVAIIIIAPIILTNTLTGISGGQYFTATNQVKVLISSQFIAAAANVLINAILIPHFGFYGAAVATTITSVACALIQYSFLIKQVKLPGLLKKSLQYCAFSITMGVVVYAVTKNMPAQPITNIIQVVIGCLVYFSLAIVFKDQQVFLLINKGISVISKK